MVPLSTFVTPSYSEISEMQARAVFEAAAEVQKAGIKVRATKS